MNQKRGVSLERPKVLALYDYLMKITKSGLVNDLEVFRTYLSLYKNVVSFFKANFFFYLRLIVRYELENDPWKMPTNFLRRVFLDLFFASQQFVEEKPSVIAELISVFRDSYQLLIDKKSLFEEGGLVLSENVHESV